MNRNDTPSLRWTRICHSGACRQFVLLEEDVDVLRTRSIRFPIPDLPPQLKHRSQPIREVSFGRSDASLRRNSKGTIAVPGRSSAFLCTPWDSLKSLT